MGPAMWRLDEFEKVASNETAIEEVVIGRAVSQRHDVGIPREALVAVIGTESVMAFRAVG